MHQPLAHREGAGLGGGGAPIAFKGIAKRYGEIDALAGFSLDIAAGEFVTFLGPSGSGKTTALNILAGFIEPSDGDVLIDGVSITRVPTEKRNVGMVFQSYSLFPHMDVRDNVGFPLRMRGVKRAERHARAEQALAMVRLAGYGGRKPHELSGGQRQRVACARAIVFEPRVLLMDEPLGALDLKLREAMQDEIRDVQRRIGCTVIYVTHDQSEALAMSDRIVVMSEGRIEQIGTPAEVYDNPRNSFVAQFVGETNFVPAELREGCLVLGGRRTTLAAPARLAAGWSGRMALRPEHVGRLDSAEAGESLAGAVTDVAFHGGSYRYVVETESAGRVIVQEQRRQGHRVPVVGETVRLGFGIDRAVFLEG
jgi:putative spermidine/putrescine transport system ATP-binding protein